ncbi:MAG: lipocalin family protein [Planctomycetota bacterium]|nr:lipocalin family protein [Planctomycetota bacterium]
MAHPTFLARASGALLVLLTLGACTSHPPLPTAESVDLERFMGDWYVQGHVPAGAEEDAYNGVESYALDERGRVLTSYVFREGGFEGPLDVTEPVGEVKDRATNATWSMRFFWLFSFEYLIGYLDEGYQETIIARTKRDYAWIMTRDPVISDERYAALAARLGAMGYDLGRLRRVPQRWPDPGHPVTGATEPLALVTRR